MYYKGNIAERTFETIGNITKKLEIRGIKTSILNDPSIILYGVIDVINETRIILSVKNLSDKLDEISYIIAEELGMHHYVKSIRESLVNYGLSVLNPLFIPMIIIETARTSIDYECVDHTYKYAYDDKYIYVPKLEPLITKLYSYSKYPYIQYSLALYILHKNRIDSGYLESLFKKSGLDINEFYGKFSIVRDFFKIFPELSKYINE